MKFKLFIVILIAFNAFFKVDCEDISENFDDINDVDENKIIEKFDNLDSKVKQIKKSADKITSTLGALDSLKDKVNEAKDTLTGMVKDKIGAASNLGGITNVVGGGTGGITGGLGGITGGIGGISGGAGGSTGGATGGLTSGITNGLTSSIGGVVDKIIGIPAKITDVKDTIKGIVKDKIAGVPTIPTVPTIPAITTTIPGGITTPAVTTPPSLSSIGNQLSNVAESISGLVVDKIAEIPFKITEVKDSFTGYVKDKFAGVPTLPTIPTVPTPTATVSATVSASAGTTTTTTTTAPASMNPLAPALLELLHSLAYSSQSFTLPLPRIPVPAVCITRDSSGNQINTDRYENGAYLKSYCPVLAAVPYSEAAAECKQYGMTLTSIESPKTKLYVEGILQNCCRSSFWVNGNPPNGLCYREVYSTFLYGLMVEDKLCSDPNAKYSVICEFMNINPVAP